MNTIIDLFLMIETFSSHDTWNDSQIKYASCE